MLDISRLENDSLEIEVLPHNLLALVEKVVAIQKVTHKKHVLHLVLNGVQADEKLMACIDEHSIMQVLDNLINNAAKYSAANSNIEVGIRHSSDSPNEVLLWVKDEGIGIASDELPHIFKRFHRAKNIDRSISGLGIGLYLVHEHVSHHRGRVWAESTQGAGSTFYILLPLQAS
jgi:signal transduction histidine kinase